VGHSQLLYLANNKIFHARRGLQKNPEIIHGLPDDCPPPLCMPALFYPIILFLKLTPSHDTTKANNNSRQQLQLPTANNRQQQQQPYYNQTTTILQGQDDDTK
jgi:hypothetical protein